MSRLSTMAIPRRLNFTFFFLLYFFLVVLGAPSSTNPDLKPLLDFKASSDITNKLTTWNSTSDPCTTWTGVSCLQDRVSRLVLEDLQLTGSFDSITSLSHLRVLSLKRNRFTGPVPNLSNLTALKLLFLSHNDFIGEFPGSLQSLFKLYRLDLSFNKFSGQIPLSVNRLTHLLTLRLEGNGFSGSISGLDLPNLQDLNVSGNHLSGQIPDSLSGFPDSAFAENLDDLCGSPMQACKPTVIISDRAKPVTPTTSIVASSPSSFPTNSNKPQPTPPHKPSTSSKISTVAVIAIVVGDLLVLAFISLLLYCYFWRNYAKDKKRSQLVEGEKIVYSASSYSSQPVSERGSMVFFEGVRPFELEDLLRASAEMLGKGGFGTSYKAVLDDGNVVAVKRLKDANVGSKREFDKHMEVLGKLRHPNLVTFKAYYFAREEKLLVSDYMHNGSLFCLLHGNRGPGRTPLDWTTRLKIAAGAARGLAFIHYICKSPKLAHGNIKSTNVLLDKSGNARVADFGLSIFATPNTVPRSSGYRAPELSATDGRKQSQKSDVYSFGVLLMELLTGKSPSAVDGGGGMGYSAGRSGLVDLPRWVNSVVREEWTAEVFDLELMRYKNIEEEMVGLLQIAMSCTSAVPDQRPNMGHVVKMIEELRGVEFSPCHETFDSVSESPCLSEATTYGGGVTQ